MSLFIALTILLLGFAENAYAYMDPGSGSLLLQLIIGGIAGMAVALRLYWKKIKDIFKTKDKETSDD